LKEGRRRELEPPPPRPRAQAPPLAVAGHGEEGDELGARRVEERKGREGVWWGAGDGVVPRAAGVEVMCAGSGEGPPPLRFPRRRWFVGSRVDG
jgi:hypothetical protein